MYKQNVISITREITDNDRRRWGVMRNRTSAILESIADNLGDVVDARAALTNHLSDSEYDELCEANKRLLGDKYQENRWRFVNNKVG